MELTVNRTTKTDNSTIGQFLTDGEFECYCLEPTDRGLTADMSLADIAAIKVANQTAVPTGRYQVTKYYSPKHGCLVPCMVGIPGFAYVEIHIGNFPQDTDACLLLGTDTGTDEVLNSRVAIDAFYPKFFAALEVGDECWITYQDA
jgi:hypothetical protein